LHGGKSPAWPRYGFKAVSSWFGRVKMGSGKMMGVDYNRGLEWAGSSAGMFLNE
jgi:hypothetical protein